MPLSLEISESGLPDGARLIVDPKDRDLMDMRERMLLKTWHQARFRSGRLPKRSDLGKALLPGVLGFVLDVAIKPNGAFQFSSYGFEIARAFGKNMIGNCVSDLPAADANFISKVYRLSRNKRIPCATIHTPSIGVPVGKWLRLILPLDEAGNGIVTNFLTCNVPIDITNTVR